MKKLIKILSLAALALPVLTACGGYKETRTEEEVINELGTQLSLELKTLYSSFASSGLGYGETGLYSKYNKKVYEGDEIGLNFKISYTLQKSDPDLAEEYVTLTNDVLKAELVVKEDLDNTTLAKSLNGAPYKLSWDVIFTGYGEEFKVPGLKTTDTFINKKIASNNCSVLNKCAYKGTISEVKANTSNGNVAIFTGRFGAWFDNSYDQLYSGCFLTDGNDGLQLYAGKITEAFFDKDTKEQIIKPGDVVEICGTVSPYNGLFEVKPISVTKITEQSIIDSIAPAVVNNMTATEVNATTIKDTGKLVQVSGLKIKELPSSMNVGSHWTIKAEDVNHTEVQIYVNYHIGEDAQTAIKEVLSGLGTKSFTVTGALSAYNKPQITIVGTPTMEAGSAFVAE